MIVILLIYENWILNTQLKHRAKSLVNKRRNYMLSNLWKGESNWKGQNHNEFAVKSKASRWSFSVIAILLRLPSKIYRKFRNSTNAHFQLKFHSLLIKKEIIFNEIILKYPYFILYILVSVTSMKHHIAGYII